MSNIKPIIAIFRPRDIPEFLESISKIQIDKLWLNYYTMGEARHLARSLFLESDYTHFIILTDDLITTQENIDKLIKDAENYDIISGWCNGNTTFGKDDTDFSFTLPHDPPKESTYESYNFVTIREAQKLQGIVKVMHQGFNPSIISRKILEKINFRTSEGCCSDSCFSLDLYKAGIDQYLDTEVRSYHLKQDDSKEWFSNLQVDKKPREYHFQYADK